LREFSSIWRDLENLIVFLVNRGLSFLRVRNNHELWVFGDEITEGMREEIEYFKKIKGENKIRWIK